MKSNNKIFYSSSCFFPSECFFCTAHPSSTAVLHQLCVVTETQGKKKNLKDAVNTHAALDKSWNYGITNDFPSHRSNRTKRQSHLLDVKALEKNKTQTTKQPTIKALILWYSIWLLLLLTGIFKAPQMLLHFLFGTVLAANFEAPRSLCQAQMQCQKYTHKRDLQYRTPFL